MEGQITLDDYMRDTAPVEYGDKGCRCCWWFVNNECHWKSYKHIKITTYPECERFEPSPYKVPKMCASCEYSNQFVYKIKPEYQESVSRHNGYTEQAACDPVEEPNIYCTCSEGSLNRRTEYKDFEWSGFGIGHWDRQHEWDTCDHYRRSEK